MTTMTEQFRMTRLQVFNWGTFSGLYDIPIAREGFLFVGRSGSGKSTLLDALSALLVPPRWLDFNAAARDAERTGRDRNLVSYVRGAWAEQKDEASGEIGTCFLRPDTTRSVLAVTFSDGRQTIVLLRLYWLHGKTNSNNDVHQLGMIMERPFDLRELDELELDFRKLKQELPDCYISREFSAYQERFRRLLGIENESALRLLNKTQSAKNLGDLNVFLRDFMLERPATFEASDRLVEEFAELNEAHQSVVTARRQVEVLLPARAAYHRYLEHTRERALLQSLAEAVEPYREHLLERLLHERQAALGIEEQAVAGKIEQQSQVLENAQETLRDLEESHRQQGGDSIERWEAEVRQQQKYLGERTRRLAQAETACRGLDWPMPRDPERFAATVGDARKLLDAEHDEQRRDDELARLSVELDALDREWSELRREIEALRRQPSNLPVRKLDLRKRMADALGLSEAALPYVGELIEVRAQEAPWRGAIERLLHGFALSMLVDERHYASVASWVDGQHLGDKLVYHRVAGGEERRSTVGLHPQALIHKLDVKDGPFQKWLLADLRQHYDVQCVDSMAAFQRSERALTRQGQIRNRQRHEKDDRTTIDDRRNWVLGFDNHEKRAAYEQRAVEVVALRERTMQRRETLRAEARRARERCQHCQSLINLEWSDIDVAPLHDRIAQLERQIAEVRSNSSALQLLAVQITEQKALLKRLDEALSDLKGERSRVASERATVERRLAACARLPLAISQGQREKLQERFEGATLESLDRKAGQVRQAIQLQVQEVLGWANDCQRETEASFGVFKGEWKVEASSFDATLASAGDYFGLLGRLERDGLPAFESRFFELLQNQSTQNLVALSSQLNLARKEIQQRLESVNEALRQAPFNPGTFLEIMPGDRQLPEVREFRQHVNEVLSHSMADDREAAEARFIQLRKLVTRLGSGETADRNWQQVVLDVRKHVEFIGREIDAEGSVIEIYRSGAGKSGGQRQKLATTCLAAALRYQLGGSEQEIPRYAPVVLDEAFDKADSEFTTLAMNIFKNFGFQMIVATPMKAVMTLEPFIGGACFVDISDRHTSHVMLIEYDAISQRLQLPEAELALA